MVRSSIMLSPADTQTPPSPTISNKRKKAEDEDGQGGQSKKQRTRVSFSCAECHRRKQKCDRQIPCSHCIARKVPELCKAYTPGKPDQDLNLRVARLEHIIEQALPQYWNGQGHSRHPSSALDEDAHEEQDITTGTFQSGRWYGSSASTSLAPHSLIDQLSQAGITSQGLSQQSEPKIQPPPPSDLETSAAEKFKLLVQECGVPAHKISELMQELPPARMSDMLIDYYFSTINWTRYPISEREFRVAYEAVRGHGNEGGCNPNDVRFLPLLFVVLAIASRLAPDSIAGDAHHRRVVSLRYYWSSRRALLIAVAIQPDSLDIVLTRLLSARFLTFDRRITECWSQLGAAVRTAQALGLHRDGSTMGMNAQLVEYRRRIWSYLYHADRSYALVLGRPHSIQDDYTSTLVPSHVDEDAPANGVLTIYPMAHPTRLTFIILRHYLASIIGQIVSHFQRVHPPPTYGEVVQLDDQLVRFITNLPPHFALDPDRSLDETHAYIPIHRFLLITEILFVRTSLHRPYLLRRLKSDRYDRSRQACFESAIRDFAVRKAFRESVPQEARDALSNAYREFQTAMISGIYLLLNPHGPYAKDMHEILDGFLLDHEGQREMDETTRKEVKTIEFLKAKASQVEAQDATSVGSAGSDSSAQLLLGLKQGGGSTAAYSPSRGAFSSLGPHPPPPSMTASPTIQRLQHQITDYPVGSPVSGGSPAEDGESKAQSLLDHFVHTMSNGPPVDPMSSAFSWGGSGAGDFSGWAGSGAAAPPMTDPALMGIDGNEWSYWEALVNHLQRQP
ncbi:hypothetical protein FB107DRAFT_255374, partial [Schizophyllum commune]